MLDTLLLVPPLHCNTSLHFTTLHQTTLHYTYRYFTSSHLHFTTLSFGLTHLHFLSFYFPLTSLDTVEQSGKLEKRNDGVSSVASLQQYTYRLSIITVNFEENGLFSQNIFEVPSAIVLLGAASAPFDLRESWIPYFVPRSARTNCNYSDC